MLRKRRKKSEESTQNSKAVHTAQSPEVIKAFHDAKKKKRETKLNLLKSAKSTKALSTKALTSKSTKALTSYTTVESDKEESEQKESHSVSEAGNSGQAGTTQLQKLGALEDIQKELTGNARDDGDDAKFANDDNVDYVQQLDDSYPFEFNADEAAFVRLVECVRKYALENRLNNGSALWPVERNSFNPLPSIFHFNPIFCV